MIRFHDLLLPLALAVICATASMANPIDEGTARQNALQFIHNNKMKRVGGTIPMSMSFTIDRSTTANVSRPMIYAFNIGDGDGYIIVSGDDAAEPILGYAEEGSVNYTDIPVNMRTWLEGYADQIAWAQTNSYNKPASMLSNPESRKDVPNLVAAKWQQSYPYNLYCVFKNNECLTGCIATSMAEIMFYWGVQGRNGETFRHGCKALPSYRTETRKFSINAIDSVDTFNWDAMTASKPQTFESITAVAKLMRYCGQAVKMDYDTYANGGSGAYPSNVARALINYFGYDSNARYILQSNYSWEEWDETIYQEIASGRPIIINGENSSGTNGHAFICTGYHAGTGLYYINWGWGGTYDGWYALNALKTSSKTDFRFKNSAVIGIQPPTDDDSHFDEPTLAYLYLHSSRTLPRSSRTTDSDTEIELESMFTYLNPSDESWEYGVGVFNTAGDLIKVIDAKESTTDVNRKVQYSLISGKHKTFRFLFGGELPYGTYNLSPVYREDHSSPWEEMRNNYVHYIKADVEREMITLTPSVDIHVDALTCENDADGTYNNTITLTNTGNEETMGVYTLTVSGTDVAQFEPHIAPGNTESITLDYKGAITDGDIQQLSIDPYGFTHFYTNVPENDYDEVSYDMYVENSPDETGKLLGNTCQARLYLCNKGCLPYRHTVTASINEYGIDEPAQSMSHEVELLPHESLTLSFDFDNLSESSSYNITLSFPHQDISGNKLTDDNLYESDALTLTHGVLIGTSDGVFFHDDGLRAALSIPDDALYVDARHSINTESLIAGGNPNTLYLLPSGATCPESLQGRNVLIGDHAAHISLDHQYEFYSPIDFTADTISYTRIFSTGHSNKNRGGWSTIALPFSVESGDVTVNGDATTWFKSSEDAGRKFWLYEYTSDDSQAITFSYTLSIEAYKPYIIAVPDNAWGSYYDLRHKPIVFTGYNASILAGDQKAIADHDGNYCFVGQTRHTMRSHIFALNEQGVSFDYLTDYSGIAAFNAYFVNYEDNSTYPVTFSFDTRDATPVKSVLNDVDNQQVQTSVYTIDGVRTDNHSTAPGIYIINGKKYIRK